MAKYIDKDALVAEIDNMLNTKEHTSHSDEMTFNSGRWKALKKVKDIINTLEVKEVDLELITGWFDHIAQIADDRMTLTNQRMTDAHALDEIKCLAKNSSEFITKHYKAQKGEGV